ncbi:MAG: hypothetical protein PHR96_01430 [Clostridia bacterium]|nr:hypothetical protein [Clostridia bacterium]
MNKSGDESPAIVKPEQKNLKPENYGNERVREYIELQANSKDEMKKPTQEIVNGKCNEASGRANYEKDKQNTDCEKERIKEFDGNNFDIKKLDTNLETAQTPVYKNCLLGKIDKNKYQISNDIAKELIILEKIVTSKDDNEYKAYALCGTVQFDFIISVKDIIQEGKPLIKVAYLKLVESFRKGPQSKKIYISTIVAKFQDIFTNDYLFKVKKAFHLHSKNEDAGKVFYNNESIAPFTLSAYYRFSVLETYSTDKKDSELKHIQALLKILHSSAKGRDIAEKFEKQTKFKTQSAGKKFVYAELIAKLYKLIDSAIAENGLDAPTASQINEARKKFSAENKKGPASALPSAPTVSKPASKAPAQASKGDGAKSGGGDNKPKKDDGKDKKDDNKNDKKPIIDVTDFLINNNKDESQQNKTNENGKNENMPDNRSNSVSGLINLMGNKSDAMSPIYQKRLEQTQISGKQQNQELSR